jgi:hypothetical protein
MSSRDGTLSCQCPGRGSRSSLWYGMDIMQGVDRRLAERENNVLVSIPPLHEDFQS